MGDVSEREFDMPWFPFWATDFTDSRTVRNMTPEQVGVYVLLLCDQWKEGSVPDDPEEWRGITNHADENTVRTVLERCFNAVQSGWQNERLEEVRQEQIEKRMHKVRAGKASARARRKASKRKRSNKKEHRSNAVATEDQRRTNKPESDTDTESEKKKRPPIREMWEAWSAEMFGKDSKRKLTDTRRKKFEMLWKEGLDEHDDPVAFLRKMARAIKADDWWGEKPDTHVPETVLKNTEKRERWMLAAKNGKTKRSGQDGRGNGGRGAAQTRSKTGATGGRSISGERRRGHGA